MPLTSQNWNRKLGNPFTTEALAPDAEATFDNAERRIITNIFAPVNAVPKLLGRVVIPTRFVKPDGRSWQFQFGAQLLVYPGGAANYTVGGAAPALNTATNLESAGIVWAPAIDLDTFYTAAGDVAS